MSQLRQFVQGFEGWNPKAHGDYKQWSVGFGTKARHPGEVIDRAEGERRLDAELAEARGYVTKKFPTLAPHQSDALTSFTYNLGPGWMNQPTRLRAALERGDYQTAASVMQEYNKAGGTMLPGLAKRRSAEASLFLGGSPAATPPSTSSAGSSMAPPQPGRTFTPEEAIQGRYRFANQLWNEPQASPHWASVLAEGLKGAGSGLLRTGAEGALANNQSMTQDAMRSAADAPDTMTMAKALLGSGVPDLGRQGMGLITQDRRDQANRAAELEQRKTLMKLQGEQELAQAQAMMPFEVDKAKAIATAKSDVEQAQRAAIKRERRAFAEQAGLKGRDLLTFVELGKLEKAPNRTLSVTDMTKLSEEGQKFADLTRFKDGFKDEYAGYKLGGSTAMSLARVGLPVAASENAASFWQGYDRFKNVVRNDLFGAALTRPEMEAFEKADINPNLDPKIIKKNLELQQEIAKRGLRRKATTLIAQGYEPRVVASAYGVDLRKDLGIDEDGNAVEPPKTPPPPGDATGTPPPASAPKALPKGTVFDNPSAIPEGARVQDEQTGRVFVKRGGQMVPEGPATP